MSVLGTILESEDFKVFRENHSELLIEADQQVADFKNTITRFVLDNPKEFIAEDIDQTYKNIKVFSEIATAQFSAEISAIYGNGINENEILASHSVNDYI
jgi:hypothetical protein